MASRILPAVPRHSGSDMLASEQLGFYGCAKAVIHGKMEFLHLEHLIVRYAYAYIRKRGELGIPASGKTYDLHAFRTGDLGGLYYIGRVTRSRDGEENVSFLSVAVYLLGKNAHGGLIIAEGSGKSGL